MCQAAPWGARRVSRPRVPDSLVISSPGAPCATTAMVCVNVCGLSALYRHGDVAPVSCGRGGVVATGHGAYSVKLRPHRGELKLAELSAAADAARLDVLM